VTATRERSFLERCLQLAGRARGRTSPNPMVGAVLARGGCVIAEAFHRQAGQPHAEAAVLRRAGPRARGATLYVNLEPCVHYGRTPPCVRAILDAGVRRVVASHIDPYPLVHGRGFRMLRSAGVEVRVGLLAAEARRLNEAYLTCLKTGRPFVHVKAAVSMDGRLATASGASRWISSPPSRREAHRMRAASDAVLVGAGTVLRDDPALNVRVGGGVRQPARVVLDSRLRIGPRARILSSANAGSVIIYCTPSAPRRRELRLKARGAEVIRVAGGRDGRVALRGVLRDLRRRGMSRVLIEGGGEVIGAAFDLGVVDKVSLFVAPIVLGGRAAIPLAGGRGAADIAGATRLRRLETRRIGPDLLVEGYVARRS
jgi:diaminohydroxyphosphoribosylaminopyrimidine deaminase/5-amino-6-(5-phosphoribosylamino)uracil reductase